MTSPLQNPVRELPNGVVLRAVPLRKPKGRHWVAYQGDEVVGEHKKWQHTSYVRQGEEGHPLAQLPKGERFGRGRHKYKSPLIKESWVKGYETPETLNTERSFHEWRRIVKDLANPKVKTLNIKG